MKSLQEKIEEIRRKPEHIRLRYAIVCVAAAMVLIIAVWLLSVKQHFSGMSRPEVLDQAGENFQNWGQDVENSFKSLEEGVNEGLRKSEEVTEGSE